MANIDKTTVRSEVERVKADFEELCAKDNVSPEMKVLFSSLFMIINLILSIFLEKTTKKHNQNSSIPSSQTNRDQTTPEQGDSHGKGKSDDGKVASNTRTKETTSVAEVFNCDVCGEELDNVPASSIETRTKIDIVFEKEVSHVEAQIKDCPTCHSTTKGKFPADFHGPLQYGNGLKAFVVNLLVCQMVALNRVQKLVNSMIGVVIAEASLLKFVLRLYQALAQWELDATKQLLAAPAVNVDETSLKVDKKNHWIHVYCAGDITLKFLHKGRGLKAIKDINIIPRYSGVIIHDCLAAYLSFEHCDNALCGSHLLRELTFVIDSNGYAWARNMKRLLQETCKAVSKSEEKKLSPRKYANLQKRYRNILTRGKKELPIIPPKPSGKRGKLAKSEAHNLWERFQKHEAAVLRFSRNTDVSFTNNRAERDLRMAKVKQKVSGCFRVELYAKAYCRISSYLQTMANKGINPLIAIQMALAGNVENIGGE